MKERDFENWDSFVEKFEHEAKNTESTWLQEAQFTTRDQDYIKLHILFMISASEKAGEYLGWSETNKFDKVFKNPYLHENFMLILWYKLFERYQEEWIEFEPSLLSLIRNPAFDKLLETEVINTLLSSVTNIPRYEKRWRKCDFLARKIAESETLSNEAREVILLQENIDMLYLCEWVAGCETTPASLLVTALEKNLTLRINFENFHTNFQNKSIQGAREKYSIDETVPDSWVAKTMNWGNINGS